MIYHHTDAIGSVRMITDAIVVAHYRGDGRELYFLALDGTLMAADFTAGGPPIMGEPRGLFETGLQPTYNLDHFESSTDVASAFLLGCPSSRGRSRP